MRKDLIDFIAVVILLLFIGVYISLITKIGLFLSTILSMEEARVITLGLVCLCPFTSILPALYVIEKLENKFENKKEVK